MRIYEWKVQIRVGYNQLLSSNNYLGQADTICLLLFVSLQPIQYKYDCGLEN
jgi:hypothetical protein